jgi:hypothetical protein
MHIHPNPQEGFTKTWMASDWGALTESCGGHFVTLFENRRGIKSAASSVFSRKDLDDNAPDKDHFMVHRIIMGSEENYGPNSNGDGYPAAALDKYHPTFVSNGHVFREHNNEHPRLKIGDIKAARYSGKLGRVELIEHYNIKKAAAEFEKAKAGKEIHASQSTYVPWDQCSVCSKKAKNSSFYCDDLANHMLQYMPAAKKYAFASNPILNFFDSSAVDNPADRTARYLEYRFPQGLSKAASAAPRVITGAQWAEFEGVNLASRLHLSPVENSWLQKLAAVETQGMQGSDMYRDHIASVAFSEQSDLSGDDMQRLRELTPATLFYKLASNSTLLPFDVFAGYMLDEDLATVRASPDIKEAAASLPAMFRKLAASTVSEDSVCRASDMALFAASGRVAAEYDQACTHEHERSISQTAKIASFAPAMLQQRVVAVADAYDVNVKRASQAELNTAPLSPIVALYGLYKIAALRDSFKEACHTQAHHCAAVSAVMQNLACGVI